MVHFQQGVIICEISNFFKLIIIIQEIIFNFKISLFKFFENLSPFESFVNISYFKKSLDPSYCHFIKHTCTWFFFSFCGVYLKSISFKIMLYTSIMCRLKCILFSIIIVKMLGYLWHWLRQLVSYQVFWFADWVSV